MSERTCLDCEFWKWYTADPGYSSLTPGSDASMYCGKGHWMLDMWSDERSTVRSNIKAAETCPDFKPDPSMPGETQP